jgi:stearoyl-CoA desaturase (delta-9 desaturase)
MTQLQSSPTDGTLLDLTGLPVEVGAPVGEGLVKEHKVQARVQVVNLLGVIIPFLALIGAIALLWGVAFNWLYLGLLLGMYMVTGLAITIGYHRYFTHKSFSTSRFGSFMLGFFGIMAAEGSILEWVACHRRHHQHSDTNEDPHSPHVHADDDFPHTVMGSLKGFVHAHMGWMIRLIPVDQKKYCPDLLKDQQVVTLCKWSVPIVALGLLIPAAIAGVATMSWTGAALGFLWGGLVRVFMVHHITWSINSVCHIWGTRPFESHDESRNNALFGVIGFGEGWHNNHHAFPASARHGLRWWEFDMSYILIKMASWVGLVWDVRVPDAQRVASKLRVKA